LKNVANNEVKLDLSYTLGIVTIIKEKIGINKMKVLIIKFKQIKLCINKMSIEEK